MIKGCFIIILVLLNSGCTIKKKPAPIFEAEILPQPTRNTIAPKPMPPSYSKRYPIEAETESPAVQTGKLLDQIQTQARQKPTENQFFNAVMQYDYMPGALYQIYTAPFKITDIMLQPGEKMTAPPQAGDTSRWIVGTLKSGEPPLERQHITLKPTRANLKTNLIIATNLRTYSLELVSFKNSYMTLVAWHYPQSQKLNFELDTKDKAITLSKPTLSELNFNYSIKRKRGKPIWIPTRVFDDGQKTYIQFPRRVSHTELPSLFLITRESKVQLVNYRYKSNYMIIDRLIDAAELRLGKRKPRIVRISRNG